MAAFSIASAAPFDASLVHNRMCLSGNQTALLVQIARSNKDALSDAKLDHELLAITQKGDVVASQVAGVSLNETSGEIASNEAQCVVAPASELLSAHQFKIPNLYVLSIEAIATAFPNAGNPDLSVLNKQNTVTAYQYGTDYVIVAVVGTAANSKIYGCVNQATYRVNVHSFSAIQFDGCVEGHKRTLPSFGQLPPQ